MGLITPGIGLLFWMFIAFTAVLFILRKFAWKPILQALKERETSITTALSEARMAREEVSLLKVKNNELIHEVQEERDAILKEARDTKSAIVADAKNRAKEEADRMIKQAREEILSEKNAAMSEIRSHVASLSIEIAEKILKSELSEEKKQKALIDNLIDEIKLN
ncbi:MAG TPA: F0F1 ATP synthase subunit B [Flavobacteriales bacterium]|nr:F0F1 ATP synthase subunit B [Flavobacteriales bacterium]HIO67282.1 ATP synthase F0 subunit B [Flavobacteriales bacterium]